MPRISQTRVHHFSHALLFLGILGGVYATALTLTDHLPHLEGSGAIAIGLTMDMVVVVPLAFYLLIVRRYGLSVLTLAPVLILSVIAGSSILPASHQQTLHALEGLVALMEISLVSWIAWRAARALRSARRDGMADPLEQFRRAAFELLQNDRRAGIFATEIGVFYYSLGAWRARPHAPAGTSAFSHHRRSGQAAIVFALLLLMLVEGIAVHFLLLIWSSVAAWLFTAGTLYGALWLIADYRATVLRPILIDDETVLLRAGLRWTVRVPRANLSAFSRRKPEPGKEILSLTFMSTPSLWLTLSDSLPAQGPYGFQRPVRAIGIQPDAAEELEHKLVSRPAC
jgi:hypothetical protein